MNKRKPHRLETPQPVENIEVEQDLVTSKGRYLGELASDPQANIGDSYWNTGSSKVRLLTKLGRKVV